VGRLAFSLKAGTKSRELHSPSLVIGVMHKEGQKIVETPVEARAGFLDRPVLIVLSISIVMVIIAFVLVYFFLK
jgi:hypothetical protein